MNPLSILNRRVRGFRVIELAATAVLTVMVLSVYLAKTGAGDKRDDIERVQQQIDEEASQIRLLRAEVASEERPERLGALAGQYLNLQPVSAKHEIDPEALADIAQIARSQPAAAAAKPAPAVPVPAALIVPASAPIAAASPSAGQR